MGTGPTSAELLAPHFGRRTPNPGEVLTKGSLPSDQRSIRRKGSQPSNNWEFGQLRLRPSRMGEGKKPIGKEEKLMEPKGHFEWPPTEDPFEGSPCLARPDEGDPGILTWTRHFLIILRAAMCRRRTITSVQSAVLLQCHGTPLQSALDKQAQFHSNHSQCILRCSSTEVAAETPTVLAARRNANAAVHEDENEFSKIIFGIEQRFILWAAG